MRQRRIGKGIVICALLLMVAIFIGQGARARAAETQDDKADDFTFSVNIHGNPVYQGGFEGVYMEGIFSKYVDDISVEASLEGNTSPDTIIEFGPEYGFTGTYAKYVGLHVGYGETADKLTVTVWPKIDPSKKVVCVYNVIKRARVSRIDVVCDEEAINATEGEVYLDVNKRLYSNIEITSENVEKDDDVNQYYSLVAYDGERNEYIPCLVDTKKKIWIRIPVSPTNDCVFSDEIFNCKEVTKVSDLENVEVWLNGEPCKDALIQGHETSRFGGFVFVPIKIYSREVVITDSKMSIEKGGAYTFHTKIYGSGKDDTIIWSVTGNTSEGTTVDESGKLVIAADEEASQLTVQACLKENQDVFSSVEIVVADGPQTITDVSITGRDVAYPGELIFYEAVVKGNQFDKSVTWSMTGNTSAGTTITKQGKLTIAKDEEATKLTLKAQSNFQPDMTGEKVIEIKKPKVIKEVSLNIDFDKLEFTTADTADSLAAEKAKDSLKTDSEEFLCERIYGQIYGTDLTDGSPIWMFWTAIDDIVSMINHECRAVYDLSVTNEYAYYWADCITGIQDETASTDLTDFSIKINGEERSDVSLMFLDGRKMLRVFVPAGTLKCVEVPTLISNPSTCIKKGKEDYYYCSNCNRYFYDIDKKRQITDLSELKDLPLAEHTLKVISEKKEATCTQDGKEKVLGCSLCEHLEGGEVIKAPGHKWDQGVVTKEPTYEEEGIKTLTCIVCKETQSQKLEKLKRVEIPIVIGDKSYTVLLEARDTDGNMLVAGLNDILKIKGKKVTFAKAKNMNSKVTGYSFKRFYIMNGDVKKKVTSLKEKQLTDNLVITAEYEENTYTVKYKIPKKVDGVRVKGKLKPAKAKYNADMILADNETLTVKGHKLLGFTNEKNSKTVKWSAGSTVKMSELCCANGSSKSIILYPVWEQIE